MIINAVVTKVEHRQKPDKRGEAQYFPETVRIKCFFERKSRTLRTRDQDEVVADGRAVVPSKVNILVGDRVTLRPTRPSEGGEGSFAVLDINWTWGQATKALFLQEVA